MRKRVFSWMQEPAGGYRGVTVFGASPFPAHGGTCFCDIARATPGQLDEQTPLIAPPFGLAKPSASSTIRANRNCRRNSRLNGGPCGDGGLPRPRGGEAPHTTFPFLLPRWDGAEEESKPVSVEFGIR